jgi:glycosyltransferase involved in cell wall biosynthesis
MVHYSELRLDSRIQRQARALAERGDEVDLVCLGEREELRVGAGRIRVHPVSGAKAAGGAGSYLGGYARFGLAAARRVAALDLRRRFDLVEAHNMPDVLAFAGLAPKLRGRPVILNLHDTFPELFSTKFARPMDHPAVRAILVQERLSTAFADALITVTPAAAERLAERGADPGKVTVVMNAPDEGVFGPRAATPVALPAEGPLRAIYHGGLAPRFGVELLIRAMGELPEGPAARLRLRVCGTGSEQAALAALAERVAPGRVDVAPAPIPFADIPGELARAHLGVVPTLRDHFTELLLPVKLLEYVHVGLPAVAPALPVIERYFGPGELRFFAPGDAASLAGALADVVARPREARARAERAGRRLEEIAWAAQRERYLALVDELAARGARRPEPRRGTSAARARVEPA